MSFRSTQLDAQPTPIPMTVNVDWDETLILPPPRLKGRDVHLDENRYLHLEVLANDLFEITLPSDIVVGDHIDVNNGYGQMREILIEDEALAGTKIIVNFNDPEKNETYINVGDEILSHNKVEGYSAWTCGLCW